VHVHEVRAALAAEARITAWADAIRQVHLARNCGARRRKASCQLFCYTFRDIQAAQVCISKYTRSEMLTSARASPAPVFKRCRLESRLCSGALRSPPQERQQSATGLTVQTPIPRKAAKRKVQDQQSAAGARGLSDAPNVSATVAQNRHKHRDDRSGPSSPNRPVTPR
jgi:hypothetical protein